MFIEHLLGTRECVKIQQWIRQKLPSWGIQADGAPIGLAKTNTMMTTRRQKIWITFTLSVGIPSGTATLD